MVKELENIEALNYKLKLSGTIGKNCISCGDDISYFPKEDYRLYCLNCFKRVFDKVKDKLEVE